MAEHRDIVTVIDRLLEYVNENGFVKLSSASKALALDSAQVEKLALLLEENDLMEVHYTLAGVRLAKKEESSEEESKEAVERVNRILKQTQELSQQVMTSEHLLKFMEHDLVRRFEFAEKLLGDLEKNKSYTPKEMAFVKKEISKIEKQLSAFQSEIDKLDKREDRFKERLAKFKSRLKKARVSKKGASGGLLRRVSRFFGFVSKEKGAEPAKKREPKKKGGPGFFARFFGRGKKAGSPPHSAKKKKPPKKAPKKRGGRKK